MLIVTKFYSICVKWAYTIDYLKKRHEEEEKDAAISIKDGDDKKKLDSFHSSWNC